MDKLNSRTHTHTHTHTLYRQPQHTVVLAGYGTAHQGSLGQRSLQTYHPCSLSLIVACRPRLAAPGNDAPVQTGGIGRGCSEGSDGNFPFAHSRASQAAVLESSSTGIGQPTAALTSFFRLELAHTPPGLLCLVGVPVPNKAELGNDCTPCLSKMLLLFTTVPGEALVGVRLSTVVALPGRVCARSLLTAPLSSGVSSCRLARVGARRRACTSSGAPEMQGRSCWLSLPCLTR